MRYRGVAYAIRNHCVADYLQWPITGTSPSTHPVDIQAKLEQLRRDGMIQS